MALELRNTASIVVRMALAWPIALTVVAMDPGTVPMVESYFVARMALAERLLDRLMALVAVVHPSTMVDLASIVHLQSTLLPQNGCPQLHSISIHDTRILVGLH